MGIHSQYYDMSLFANSIPKKQESGSLGYPPFLQILNFSPPISSRFNRSTFVNRSCSPCLVVSPSWNLPKPQGEDCEGHVCRSYSRTSRASATSSNLLQMCELAYGSNQCCIFWNGLHKDFKPWLVWSSRIC